MYVTHTHVYIYICICSYIYIYACMYEWNGMEWSGTERNGMYVYANVYMRLMCMFSWELERLCQ